MRITYKFSSRSFCFCNVLLKGISVCKITFYDTNTFHNPSLTISTINMAQSIIKWQAPAPGELTADNSKQISTYLKRFGYLPPGDADTSSKALKKALADLQSFAGIATTGMYDDATAKLFITPRCGFADRYDHIEA